MPTPGTREWMQQISRLPRKPLSPEHRQAISEGLIGSLRARGPRWPLSALTDKERADYDTYKRNGFTRAEAFEAIGRRDLISEATDA